MKGSSVELNKLIGIKVMLIRKEKKIPQPILAFAIGVSRQQLANIESGATGTTIENVMKIAKYFKVGVADILPKEDQFEVKLNDTNPQQIRMLEEAIKSMQDTLKAIKKENK